MLGSNLLARLVVWAQILLYATLIFLRSGINLARITAIFTAINFAAKFERLLECIVWLKFSCTACDFGLRNVARKVKFNFHAAACLKINLIYLIDIYAVFG